MAGCLVAIALVLRSLEVVQGHQGRGAIVPLRRFYGVTVPVLQVMYRGSGGKKSEQ